MIEHSSIGRIQRLGYPDETYLEFELVEEETAGVDDEEFWPDGLSWEEWRKTH